MTLTDKINESNKQLVFEKFKVYFTAREPARE